MALVAIWYGKVQRVRRQVPNMEDEIKSTAWYLMAIDYMWT